MNRQELRSATTRWYSLEPGDATRYTFGWSPAEGLGAVFGGVGDGSEYVLLCINMPGGSGVAVVPKWDLRLDALPHLYGYLREHGMRDVDPYTLAAVLLAMTVLVEEPANTEAACARMRQVPYYLREETWR